MEWFEQYTVLVVAGICLCVGYVVKNLVPSKKINRFIPLMVAALGCFVNIWLCNFSVTPQILLEGMVSGLSSTGMHQALTQFLEKNK